MNITSEMQNLLDLALAAMPKTETEWGSDRQTAAESAFFEAFHEAVGDTPEFDEWCDRATTAEMVAEALRIAGEHFDEADEDEADEEEE